MSLPERIIRNLKDFKMRAPSSDYERFKAQLAQHYQFPTWYLFKFIVPSDREEEFRTIFRNIKFDSRNSKTGKYVSFSKKMKVNSSEEVIDIYKRAYAIEGIISL